MTPRHLAPAIVVALIAIAACSGGSDDAAPASTEPAGSRAVDASADTTLPATTTGSPPTTTTTTTTTPTTTPTHDPQHDPQHDDHQHDDQHTTRAGRPHDPLDHRRGHLPEPRARGRRPGCAPLDEVRVRRSGQRRRHDAGARRATHCRRRAGRPARRHRRQDHRGDRARVRAHAGRDPGARQRLLVLAVLLALPGPSARRVRLPRCPHRRDPTAGRILRRRLPRADVP